MARHPNKIVCFPGPEPARTHSDRPEKIVCYPTPRSSGEACPECKEEMETDEDGDLECPSCGFTVMQ